MTEAKQATPHSQLISELMDSRVPKTEREHAAAREIERLRAALEQPEQEPVAVNDELLKALQSAAHVIEVLGGSSERYRAAIAKAEEK
jgi:hypothetical protein